MSMLQSLQKLGLEYSYLPSLYELDTTLDLDCHQPEGFRVLGPDGSPLVCKLIKSLYGLKQAPRAWSQLVKKVLLAEGFTMSKAEPA